MQNPPGETVSALFSMKESRESCMLKNGRETFPDFLNYVESLPHAIDFVSAHLLWPFLARVFAHVFAHVFTSRNLQLRP